jgi:hypothetical protein
MATTIQEVQQGFAEPIRPYAEELLGKAQLYTDPDLNPYMQYTGDRVSQFTPLQQQSYENAALMQTAPQIGDATALTGQAGIGALNTQYTFRPADFASTFSRDAQGNMTSPLMNPYMQSVVERQQADAQRQSDIAMQAQNAQAARSGAFGGSGNQNMRMQALGNLARQKGDIQAQGLNNAFQQAMQQYNTQNQLNAQQQQFGAGLGLQGLQTANQSAMNLGALGNQQYQQNMGINQMQNQLGGQQQQQTQNILNTQYQDYLNYQNYPYKQMGFMSDMIRGLPLAQQSATTYASPPSAVQQAAGLAITGRALGAFAGGGSVNERPAGLAELAIYRMGQD